MALHFAPLVSRRPPIDPDPNNSLHYPFPAPPGREKLGINGESRGWEVKVAGAVTITLAAIFVISRVVTKFFITKSPGWDDYTCILGFAFAIARVVDDNICVDWYQLGQHVWDIDIRTYLGAFRAYKMGYLFYLMAVMCIKLSIILLLFRLFQINKRTRFILYGLSFVVVGYCIGLFFAIIFQCGSHLNFTESWHYHYKHADCANLPAIDIAVGGFNIFTDATLLALPFPLVMKLHVSKRQVLGLCFVFSTGLLVLAVSIVREVLVVKTLNTGDTEWTSVDDVVWLTVEMNVGLICACLPLLPPLFRRQAARNVFIVPYNSLVGLLTSHSSRSRSRGTRIHDNEESNTNLAARQNEIELGAWKDNGVMMTTAETPRQYKNSDLQDERSHQRIGVQRDIYTEVEHKQGV